MQNIKNYTIKVVAVLILGLIAACSDGPNESQIVVEEVYEFDSPRSVYQDPTPRVLSPQESLETFRLPKGYRMELVASEPMISEPVALAWDENGRMYVAQMETYMQTVDTTGEHVASSKVMLLEDTDNDGVMDKSSVFIDKLMLPRMVLCVGNEVLVNETDTYDIYAYKDTNGDGKADQKRPVYEVGKKAPGNLEHQRSGLVWNIDNWIYQTVDPIRFKYKGGMLVADTLHSGTNGQWGLTHDNYGRLFFSRGGAENAGIAFQINPKYGQLDFEDTYVDSLFSPVWPIVKTPDVQGGAKRLREDSTLNHFTAGSGQVIFRGDRLPASMVGDYFINEPVARIVRRANVVNKEGKTFLENVYQQDEFIASTDMNFRPVTNYTGPDGCLYIVDMHRGIIQEGTWTGEGTYLREQILKWGLDKNKQNGRIYRVVYDGIKPGPKPKMLDESTKELVEHLDHPNGWWRDNAQKEIIVRGDRSVVSTLKDKATGKAGWFSEKFSALGRLHALWTLEGLEAIDKDVLFTALQDEDPQVRRAAIIISEPYLKNNDEQLIAKLADLKNDSSHDVLIQLVLSLSMSNSESARAIESHILKKYPDNEMLARIPETVEKNKQNKEYGAKYASLSSENRALVKNGAIAFKSICASCHGAEGLGLPNKMAPPLVGSYQKALGRKEETIKIVLHGLTGPVDGVTYHEMMPPMGSNDDEWIASVLSYLRLDLGLSGVAFTGSVSPEMAERVLVTPEEVKKVREQTKGRNKPYTWEELNKEKVQ